MARHQYFMHRPYSDNNNAMARIKVRFDDNLVWYPLPDDSKRVTVADFLLSITGRPNGRGYIEDAQLLPHHIAGNVIMPGDILTIDFPSGAQALQDEKIAMHDLQAENDKDIESSSSSLSDEDDASSSSESDQVQAKKLKTCKRAADSDALSKPSAKRSRIILSTVECMLPDTFDVAVPSFPYSRPEKLKKFTQVEKRVYESALGPMSNNQLSMVHCVYTPCDEFAIKCKQAREGMVVQTQDPNKKNPDFVHCLVRSNIDNLLQLQMDMSHVTQDPTQVFPDFGYFSLEWSAKPKLVVCGQASMLPPKNVLIGLRDIDDIIETAEQVNNSGRTQTSDTDASKSEYSDADSDSQESESEDESNSEGDSDSDGESSTEGDSDSDG